jgi:glycosyltransferase involved in cell wall biosynthesis
MTKFVIITPSFNNENWVDIYVDSILNQTYTNYTVIYIDDCSTDSTFDKVYKKTNGNSKFVCIKNEKNQQAFKNYIDAINKYSTDEDVVVMIDGDDWLATNHVLENLNKMYVEGTWMTYGGMYAYDGEKAEPAFPQNTPYDDFVHKYSLYRRDLWRASHLRTFKKFLWDGIDQSDFYSKINGELFNHASDLCFMYSLLEICPINKIGVIDFPSYIYNASNFSDRGAKRETIDNQKFEVEIRNKRKYKRVNSKEEIKKETLPQINIFGDIRERNSIPTSFGYVYNRSFGDFNIVMFQDEEILRYLSNEYDINFGNAKIVADIQEATHLFNQRLVVEKVKQYSDKFDLILSCDQSLSELQNCVIRPVAAEVVLNKNIHTQEWPTLSDNSLIKIYPKIKMVSCISSDKSISDGHRFRLECVKRLMVSEYNVDFFGKGINEITGKISALKDYCFSVAIENGSHHNYFTEKLLDCFLTGTIPIYCGCPNIGEYFDVNGFYTFQTIDELIYIIKNLSFEDYIKKSKLVEKNFEIALNLKHDNDSYFNKYLKNLLT